MSGNPPPSPARMSYVHIILSCLAGPVAFLLFIIFFGGLLKGFAQGLGGYGPWYFGIHLAATATLSYAVFSALFFRRPVSDLIPTIPLLLAALAVWSRLSWFHQAYEQQHYRWLIQIIEPSRTLLLTCLICTAASLLSTRAIFACRRRLPP